MRRRKYLDKGEEYTPLQSPSHCGIYCRKKKREEKLIDRKNVKYGSAGGDDKTE